jgi:hypothetical protein
VGPGRARLRGARFPLCFLAARVVLGLLLRGSGLLVEAVPVGLGTGDPLVLLDLVLALLPHGGFARLAEGVDALGGGLALDLLVPGLVRLARAPAARSGGGRGASSRSRRRARGASLLAAPSLRHLALVLLSELLVDDERGPLVGIGLDLVSGVLRSGLALLARRLLLVRGHQGVLATGLVGVAGLRHARIVGSAVSGRAVEVGAGITAAAGLLEDGILDEMSRLAARQVPVFGVRLGR